MFANEGDMKSFVVELLLGGYAPWPEAVGSHSEGTPGPQAGQGQVVVRDVEARRRGPAVPGKHNQGGKKRVRRAFLKRAGE